MLLAGSKLRLLLDIPFTLVLMLMWNGFAATATGLGFYLSVFVLLSLLHSLALAFRLIGLTTPVVSAGPDGLTLSDRITDHGLIPWTEIKALSVPLAGFKGKASLFSFLLIRTGKSKHFSGFSRLLPSSWLGIYMIPTRLLNGESEWAEEFCASVKHNWEEAKTAAVSEKPPIAIPEPKRTAAPGTSGPILEAQLRAQALQQMPQRLAGNKAVLLNGKPLG